jgi:archaellum component FlaC
MKKLSVISLILLTNSFVSGQELQRTMPEAVKLCQSLTHVKTSLVQIKGLLGEMEKYNTEITQVSLRNKNLSFTPADYKPTISATKGKEGTNVTALTPADQIKGQVEVINRMQKINGSVLKIKEKLFVEKTNIEQEWLTIENNLKQIKGRLSASSPDHKCISDQLKELNNTVSALQIQTENVRSETDEINSQLEQQYGKGSCQDRVTENCIPTECQRCCFVQFKITAPEGSVERQNQEVARARCEATCNFKAFDCIAHTLFGILIDNMKSTAERITSTIHNMN